MMEAILQLVMEGLGACGSVLDVCREHLQERVRRGEMNQDQVDELLENIREGMVERRRILLEGARREFLRLLDGFPLVTEESFNGLEDRVRALERGRTADSV